MSLIHLLRQQLRDWAKAKRHGYLPPALWETRAWLRATQNAKGGDR